MAPGSCALASDASVTLGAPGSAALGQSAASADVDASVLTDVLVYGVYAAVLAGAALGTVLARRR